MREKAEPKKKTHKPVYTSPDFHSRVRLLAALQQTDMRDVMEQFRPEIEKRIKASIR